mmetsp:Transcript_583/g.962  ORF Transcript_583/g.962 Transcript_583/m.962 type:complete len:184 (+) Transcript_583:25-576(+)
MHDKIVKNRPHAHKLFFAPSCATEGNETVRFHSQPFANVGQQGTTKAYEGVEKKLTDVPCGPLSPVLETLLKGHVNFFSLDVEGAEALVLETIDWSKIRIDVMIAESLNKACRRECESRLAVRQIMKKAGYRLYINGVFNSDLFVHPSVQNRPPEEFREGYDLGNRMQSSFFRAHGMGVKFVG